MLEKSPETVILEIKYTDPDSISNSLKAQESIYGKIPLIPVLDAVLGIKFDFNHGIRILTPKNLKSYHITFIDKDTGNILYSNDIPAGAFLTSVKKYYVNFKLIIYYNDIQIFLYDMDLKNKDVMIQLPSGTLGDSIGWFSYVLRFQQKHQCHIICVMMDLIIQIFKNQYPDIQFITQDKTVEYKPYASYYMGLFFKGDTDNQPIDFRYAGLHRTVGYILGLDDISDIPPRVDISAKRKIKLPYVVIATQSSSQAKYWNNPFGWDSIIKFLKDSGYKVYCIDKLRVHGLKLVWNKIPFGVLDDTGDKPLQLRINMIKDADFFIGLSSGLSWLAWCCKVPVVMISGFTNPDNLFFTPYRVINYHVCNSCWNDMRCEFDHFDFLWCPRHKNDDKHFECTKMISALQVINTIKRIPSFLKHNKA